MKLTYYICNGTLKKEGRKEPNILENVKNIQISMKDSNLCIQAQRIPDRTNKKISTVKHIMVKLLKTKVAASLYLSTRNF